MKQTAFLRQKNVFKGITKVNDLVKVTFAYCDQDLQREGLMQFIGTVFQKNLRTNHESEPENFCHRLTIDAGDQKAEAQRIMKKVQKGNKQNERLFIEQQALANH